MSTAFPAGGDAQAYRRITNETTVEEGREEQRDLSSCEHDDALWRE